MPDKREVTHRDNEAETVVNDAHGSNQVGLFSEHKPYKPFAVTALETDKDMKRFAKFTDGKQE
ncbi:hypothetical protein QQ991_06135 [Weizmannia coagulans]|jgi:hypothetical protein|uniref:Uncharacterized protein n=3 Tax=Heyndrickxia TaxID=2837504 RepID=A0A0C5CEM9_HEYCO|nr:MULTISPECIES: hypothetical protein [Heyndrickxia]AEO99761.1 hypothetical protein Bcoa_0538 [Heyndrickxia coagulans 36D1]AJO24035.1 hypothetical protein SB48_HM08orf05186 [Heyndrickxia coagulans]AKN54488.1 hypothetical protein AB434_2083 [Heyndrickxia coagulans]ATW83985.1 hypothetical protein CIW84_13820 [Heyndrickxia coagulans]AVD55367.1 hypothetical protein C3766_04110 [Heyndrickxia coagulans]